MSKIEAESLRIPDVKLIRPKKFGDNRGFLSETYNRSDLLAIGVDCDVVQENHSLSANRGTVRGLHWQMPPYEQTKLVRVIRGSILDVAVDLRKGSPTYLQHVTAVISADDWNQILVPRGFAHGLCTLEPGTEVVYKIDNPYAPDHEQGLRWNDRDLAIDWPVAPDDAELSLRDAALPFLAELESPFTFAKAG